MTTRPHAGRKPKVVVLDDNLDVTMLVAMNLEFEGIEVVQLHTCAEFRSLPKTDIDLVILDVRLKESREGGIELLRELKLNKDTDQIPVIMLSGSNAKNACIALGCVAYIEKPFAPLDLSREVAMALGEAPANVRRREILFGLAREDTNTEGKEASP